MAADIYSKAGADARFLADTPAGRQKIADSPELSTAFVRVIGPSNGVDDSAMINAALAQGAGGRVVGLPGQTYHVNAPLIVPSETTFDITGCVVQQTASPTQRNMLRNAAVANARTLNDVVTTAGSSTITSATGAFTAADVGKAVRLYLGDNGRPRFLSTTIVSVTNATTVVLATAPDVSIPITGASIGTRDRNIKIIGGKWRRYTSAFVVPSDNGYHTFLLRRVDGLVVLPGSMGRGAGKYMVHLGDVTQFEVGPFWLDQAPSDGVHLGGWCFDGAVRGVWGNTGDDIVAITGADYLTYNDCSGDVSDIVFEDLTYTSSNAPGRFLVCSDASGESLSHIKLRRITLRRVGTRAQRSVAGEPLGRILLSGVLEGITIEDTDRMITYDRDGGTDGLMWLNDLEVRRFKPRFDVWDQGIILAANFGRVLLDGVEAGPGKIASNNVYMMSIGKNATAVVGDSVEVRNARLDRTDSVAVRLVTMFFPNAAVRAVRVAGTVLKALAGTSSRLVDVGGGDTLDSLHLESVLTEGTQWDISHGGSGLTRVSAINCKLGGATRARIANAGSLRLSAIESDVDGAFALGGSGTITSWSFDTRLDVGGVSRVAGAMAFNTNPARSCGVGPVYCTGSGPGSWVHVTTGATY